eukprot:SAG31_NODE_9928_length_1209_cov_0.918919_2_plen_40_part_01
MPSMCRLQDAIAKAYVRLPTLPTLPGGLTSPSRTVLLLAA